MATPSFDVTGDDIDLLVKRIRTHADAKALRRELASGLNRVSKPLREEMKKSTSDPDVLPTRDGLQALVMRKQSVIANARGGKYAGLRILVRGKKGADVGAIQSGRLRHKTFGHRPWVTQTEGIKPRWMEAEFDSQAQEVGKAMIDVMTQVARKVAG
jgi:hypothetical protein